MHLHPLWENGVIGLATKFLNYNDHLQFIVTQCVSMGVSAIEQIAIQ